MAEPKILVLRAAGTNCNEETAYAFEMAGAQTKQIHVNRLRENPSLIDEFGGAVVPGGFSYGDDVSAGAVLALELDHALGDAFRRLLARGGLVLGICNGFQVLIKSGLLPGPENAASSISASLIDNENHRYEDRWVHLSARGKHSAFLRDDEIIELPVAHAEGRFVVGGEEDLRRLSENDRIALRYVTADGQAADYPANPNGSIAGIAGISDATGQVLGLMPHPERFLFSWQHPRWTREPQRKVGDGFRIFENAVKHLAS